jgi:hypothetical protein
MQPRVVMDSWAPKHHTMPAPDGIVKDVVLAIVAAGSVAWTTLIFAGVSIALVLDNAEPHSGSAVSTGWTLALTASGLLGVCAGGYAVLTLRRDV